MSDQLSVALAQLAPVWLNRDATLEKILQATSDAAAQQADLVVFGEALLPGYPFWLDPTGGAKFNSDVQKEIHAHYMHNAVQVEAGHLDSLQNLCREKSIAVYLGCIERPSDRGGHSLYCTLVYIDQSGQICSTHRKLMPTYEERLTWSPGDGHGLRTHSLGAFTVGGLNCWENWMPLPRAALYAQGEDLHVAVWPGAVRNTIDITRFMAVESRSYVISVSGLMRSSDFPGDTPHVDRILANCGEMLSNGGSCIAAPDGSWLIEPIADVETVQVATIDHRIVRKERQNFDPSGHYSRPDVTQLLVNRERQSIARFDDDD
ncbi:MAG: carbon-nitrogen hydrolase family protein [Planctomycetaceae bacterium]|nr:carbon-nitrogen hydrolase family protein [Planctomycetaceae bacterium]